MRRPQPPPPQASPADLDGLRTALAEAGFDDKGLLAALDREWTTPAPGETPVALRRLPEGHPVTALIKLFLLELPAPRAEAEAAFGAFGVEGAARIGLVGADGDEVVPLLRLVPSGGLLFVSDLRHAEDPVMGVAPSSALLGNLTPRRRVARALDVGTGSGIQAVLAARNARRVVATDLSERALAFTELNARLNGFENVETRAGSFFDPVQGEQFGLVVSNPPFVVSPDAAFTYRDAGLPGDAVSRLVTQESAAHLEDGGIATLLAAWALDPEGNWTQPVRGWVEGLGCDTILLRYATDDPLAYAARWNPAAQAESPEALGATLDRWVAYYEELGIEALAYGAIVLRRREGASWFLGEDAPERIEPASHHVERLIDAQDFLADGRDVAYERLVLVPEHALDQALHLDDGAFAVQAAAIRLTEGLGFQAGIDVYTAHLVARLDGTRTVREAIAETAEALAPLGVSADGLAGLALPVVRRMVTLGFLVPAER